MKTAYKILVVVLALLLIIFILRGPLYRCFFSYEKCSERQSHSVTSVLLEEYIDSVAGIKRLESVERIVELSHQITSDQLSFQASRSEINPNKLYPNNRTHCVGYSAFYTAVCNYLLKQNGFADSFQCRAYCGQIHFLGYNVHILFDSAFFADHDFNCIQNASGSEKYFTDPTLYDYLRIAYVSPFSPQ
jgi:hypothetical protein